MLPEENDDERYFGEDDEDSPQEYPEDYWDDVYQEGQDTLNALEYEACEDFFNDDPPW